ncbi:MAG TPA: GMC oxidoreductase [Xanthobacteraceae bacterium]
MSEPPDFIVIGSGPAGVSAAIPLVEAGRRVLMIDGGDDRAAPAAAPWRRTLGDELEALQPDDGLSPKWRTPEARRMIGAFKRHAAIDEEDFLGVGALARGGLSRIWGSFVSELTEDELRGWPVTAGELKPSYSAVVDRIGVSGSPDDDMAAFYGRSGALLPPPPLGTTAAAILDRYVAARPDPDFALGLARNALITADRDARHACDLRLACLWGCERGAIYDARQDVAQLRRHANFELRDRATAVQLARRADAWEVTTADGNRLRVPQLILAAGTLGSLRLAAPLIDPRPATLPLLNSPVMATPLLVPRRLGYKMLPHGHSLAQLGFRLRCSAAAGDHVSGAVYEVAGLPPSSFAARMPFGRRAGTEIFRALAPALAVVTIYFPGRYSANTVSLQNGDNGPRIHIRGGVADGFDALARTIQRRLTRIWRKLGAFALPGTALATAGTDAHLGGVFPLGAAAAHGTSRFGELNAAAGLHLVDGSVLPTIPSTFTTLTIMANADRIGRHLASIAR